VRGRSGTPNRPRFPSYSPRKCGQAVWTARAVGAWERRLLRALDRLRGGEAPARLPSGLSTRWWLARSCRAAGRRALSARLTVGPLKGHPPQFTGTGGAGGRRAGTATREAASDAGMLAAWLLLAWAPRHWKHPPRRSTLLALGEQVRATLPAAQFRGGSSPSSR
jgi:hypothetical protein